MSRELTAILNDLDQHANAFDLSHGFGSDLMVEAAGAIEEQMDAELDPDGVAWEPLSEAYEKAKDAQTSGAPMAVLFGVMKTFYNLLGRQWISAKECRQTFGQDEQATDEAEWFQEGNANQPARPFYEIPDAGVKKLDDLTDHQFDLAIR